MPLLYPYCLKSSDRERDKSQETLSSLQTSFLKYGAIESNKVFSNPKGTFGDKRVQLPTLQSHITVDGFSCILINIFF